MTRAEMPQIHDWKCYSLAGMTPQVHMVSRNSAKISPSWPQLPTLRPLHLVKSSVQYTLPALAKVPLVCSSPPSSRWKTSTPRSNGKKQLQLAPYPSARSEIGELCWLPIPQSTAISPFLF